MSHVPTVLKSDRSVFDKMLPVDDNGLSSEKNNFDLLTHPQHRRGGGMLANICYHVAAFLIPFSLICNMTLFKLNGCIPSRVIGRKTKV